MAIPVTAYLKESTSSLLASRQRSLLALIGIAIGVSSVIAMLSVGVIVKGEALRQFQELGTNVLDIRIQDGALGAGRVETAIARELAALPTIAALAPYVRSRGEVARAGNSIARVDIVGATAALANLGKLRVEDGRFLSALDGRRYFCVLGAEIAAALRGAGGERIVGEAVRIGDAIYTVVGVLQSTPRGRRRFDVNRAVIIPIATAQRVLPGQGTLDITARMGPNVHHTAATAEVTAYIRRKSDDLVVRVHSAEALLEQMHRQMRLFTLLLGTVGAISLLAGGIGTMNVMLASVAERRLEIGIRRTLGARRRDIQLQFLIESVILSLAGGVFGIGLGIGGSYWISHLYGWTFGISATAIGLGVGITTAAGIFFGFYPAWQAARLDPVAALRGK